MHYELWDGTSRTILLRSSLATVGNFNPRQLNIGSAPRVSILRGFGDPDWFVVEDGVANPAPLVLMGKLESDFDPGAVQDDLDTITAAMLVCTRVYHVHETTDLAYIDVDVALPPVQRPIDGPHNTTVELMFMVDNLDWTDAVSGDPVPF